MKIFRLTTQQGPVWATELGSGYVKLAWRDGLPQVTDETVNGPLLVPVDPPAIIAIGLNYRKHAAETGGRIPDYPVVFTKGLNSLIATEEHIVLPRRMRSDKVDFECELGFVMARDAKNVSREDALDYVLGFTAANDVSARDWQKEWGGGQFCRAKSFDTFCPVGPCLVTKEDLPNFNALRIQTRVNGETLQDSSTGDLIFDIPTLIEFLSGSTTLQAGTLVLTGTPHGVGMARNPPRWLFPGDVVEVEIEGIGILRNPVSEEVC